MLSQRSIIAGCASACISYIILYINGFWDIQFITITVILFLLSGWLFHRRYSTWNNPNKWSLLLIILLIGVPLFGINAGLPLPSDLRIALWYLFIGSGIAIWGIGVEMAHTKDTK